MEVLHSCFYQNPYVTFIVYVGCSWIVVLVDELIFAYKFWIHTATLIKIKSLLMVEKTNPGFRDNIKMFFTRTDRAYIFKPFSDMNEEFTMMDQTFFKTKGQPRVARKLQTKNEMQIWYQNCYTLLSRRLAIMMTENAIQFQYQTLIIMNYAFYPDLWGNGYGESIHMFRATEIFRTISVTSSAWGLMYPIFQREEILACNKGKKVSILKYFIKVAQCILIGAQHMVLLTYLARFKMIETPYFEPWSSMMEGLVYIPVTDGTKFIIQ